MTQTTFYKSPQHKELIMTVKCRMHYGEGYLHIAEDAGVSPALVRKVDLFGVDSKKMRNGLDIVGATRKRLCIDTTPETIAAFDAARGDMSRGEYLEYLMRCDDGGS